MLATTRTSIGKWDELADALRGELAEYGGLLALLDEQRDAIVCRRVEELLDINTRVQEQAHFANRLRLEREALCARMAGQADVSAVSVKEIVAGTPSGLRPMFEALTREAMEIVARVRDKAARNSALLARAGELNEKIISIVSPGSTTRTYNARGSLYMRNARSRGNGLDMSA